MFPPENILVVISLLVTLLAAANLAWGVTWGRRWEAPARPKPAGLMQRLRAQPPGVKFLLVFAVIVVLYLIALLVWRWEKIKANPDAILLYVGLFLMMAFGMFVQVLAHNRSTGKPLFEVTASQLIFPLLFSPIVYYPIWALAGSQSGSFFAFYAAFLNGYFWESVVSAAKVPPAGTPGQPAG